MKKFTPTHFDDTVNVSTEHPLKEFLSYVVKGLVALALLYLCLGSFFEFLILNIPIKKEIWLWERTGLASRYLSKADLLDIQSEQEKYVQSVFERIPQDLKPDGYAFNVYVTKDDDPNAFALPGGNIVVTSGLLETLETQNALTFVLGHELGHIQNRDHLRGMGFGFVSVLVSITLAGQDQGVLSAISNIAGMGELGYSRKRETSADFAGLKALQETYGHVGGATEFFDKLLLNEGKLEKLMPSIMSTHPGSEARIKKMKTYIGVHHLAEKDAIPIKRFKDNP